MKKTTLGPNVPSCQIKKKFSSSGTIRAMRQMIDRSFWGKRREHGFYWVLIMEDDDILFTRKKSPDEEIIRF